MNAAEPTAKPTPRFEWHAVRALAPHLWPAGDLSIRLRVLLALALLAAAKLANVYVPLLFKRMVDLFTSPANAVVALPLAIACAIASGGPLAGAARLPPASPSVLTRGSIPVPRSLLPGWPRIAGFAGSSQTGSSRWRRSGSHRKQPRAGGIASVT